MKLFELKEQKWPCFFDLGLHTGKNGVVMLKSKGSIDVETPVHMRYVTPHPPIILHIVLLIFLKCNS